MEKLYSEACERNKFPILEKLEILFARSKSILEIGSGTGQHAVFFADNLPHLIWQTSDLIYSHESINAWISESAAKNILKPLLLDVSEYDFKNLSFDGAFTANTFHIMSLDNVKQTFLGLKNVLNNQALFCIYGPFKYKGKHTSQSNYEFDLFLNERDPQSSIRDIEEIINIAENNNFALINDFAMPSNNRLIVFKFKK